MSKHKRRTPGKLKPPRLSATFIDEPILSFAGGREHVDQKTGITVFGPRSLGDSDRHPDQIRVGFIGSGRSIGSARRWMESCQWGVPGDDDHADFPGFSEDCGFYSDLVFSDSWNEQITALEIDKVKSERFYKDRFPLSVSIISDKIKLLSRKDNPPSIIILSLPDELLKHCKVLDYVDPDLGTVHRDLRRAIKAEAMKYQMPTQILLQRTSEADENSRLVDHKSKCAWNFFTGLYFKQGGLPWSPVGLTPGSCYIGISFYKPIGSSLSSQSQVSVAQAFDEHGEGLVLRGPEFQWDEIENGKSPHLSKENAESLIDQVLEQYKEWMNQYPSRVVVHKSSRFWKDESEGLKSGISKRGIESFDFVSVHSTSHLRLIRSGKYPALRGTYFSAGDLHFLYTTGFISPLNAYPHGHVPSPLQIADHIGDSDINLILNEILIFTKMNWNSANFSISKPITLRFSELVGNILKEIPLDRDPLPQYKFYI